MCVFIFSISIKFLRDYNLPTENPSKRFSTSLRLTTIKSLYPELLLQQSHRPNTPTIGKATTNPKRCLKYGRRVITFIRNRVHPKSFGGEWLMNIPSPDDWRPK
ncbi:hypothetical protein CDAR_196231 [Caerostris darwini]|uniref:Uncharacterized protein n=1 Tax=Caerostris darwini TaxID=1538125 RepID=A0AAV4MHQ1_9ARAC|nr:hypothetical protein CDAR_196231 [Caerostris darwini]